MNIYYDIANDSDQFVTDNPVHCDNVLLGRATLGLMKSVADRIRPEGKYIIQAVCKNPKCDEDRQPQYIPSLAPDYFMFKEKDDHKGREFAKKYWAVETL